MTTEIIDGASSRGRDAGAAGRLAQRDEYLDSLRRLQAEFENYKKRVTKQQTDQTARAAVSLVEKLLPVLDTLDLATEHLGRRRVGRRRAPCWPRPASCATCWPRRASSASTRSGEAFDPNAHEAVGHLPADGRVPMPTGSVRTAEADGRARLRPASRSWPRSCGPATAGAARWCVRPW